MKILLALLLLSPIASFAAVPAAIPDELNCYEPNHAPDHAWNATVRKGYEAEVVETSITGPRRVTRLRCTQVANPHPERPGYTIYCQVNTRFGYVLTVSNSFFRTTARLDQRTFPRGTRNLTTMVCGSGPIRR